MLKKLLMFVVVLGVMSASAPKSEGAGFFKKLFKCKTSECCEPAPTCCEPAPEPCCEPAPEPCCEPAPEPCCEPAPEPCCEPAPEPCCEPAPEPCCEPTPAPAPCCSAIQAMPATQYAAAPAPVYYHYAPVATTPVQMRSASAGYVPVGYPVGRVRVVNSYRVR